MTAKFACVRGQRRNLSTDADPVLAAVARGVVQHHVDDAWFHATPAFNELSLAFAVEIRAALAGRRRLSAQFSGPHLVELLLDAGLTEEDPQRLDDYYAALAALDPAATEQAVSRLATRPVDRIAALVRDSSTNGSCTTISTMANC